MIHPFFFHLSYVGCGGNRLRRVFQTSFSSATLFQLFLGIPGQVRYIIRPAVLGQPQGFLPVGCAR